MTVDIERAREIFRAEETIPVTLNGQPVWIENVDTSNERVQVHMQNDPEDRKTVAPNQLQELQ